MDIEKKINVMVSFNDGPRVDIIDNHSKKYLLEYYENLGDDWSVVHTVHDMKPYHFYGYNRKFRTNWRIKIWGWENKPVLLFDHIYDERDKDILLVFNHNNYNVQKKWLDYAINHRNKFRYNLSVQSKFSNRLKDDYFNKNINFFDVSENPNVNFYATYKIKKFDIQSQTANLWESGLIFENHGMAYKTWDIPIDWVSIPNEKIIEYILNYE